MDTNLFACFDEGRVTAAGMTRDMGSLPWKAHPKFIGVSLKDMVSSEDAGGLFSCHLVRIEPGCAIGLHTHPASIELHEVMAGGGVCVVNGDTIPYAPGNVAVVPCAVAHEVRAGVDGLCLFAKFVAVTA